MDFRILGPLEVISDGRPLSVAPGQRRALLIDLLLHANEVVSDDRLVEDLWGEEQPPPTARKIVQLHVSKLRGALGAERIRRSPPGYMLRIEPGEVDTDRVRAASERAAAVQPRERVQILQQGLAEWRGPALVDVEYLAFARGEVDRLTEMRLSLLERLYAARLELGEHAEVVGELEALVAEQPLRERARALLMLALYRSGRHADALDRFRSGRTLVVAELGLEPGPELQRLERQILGHDPTLEPATPPRAAGHAQRWHPRLVLLLAAIGAAAAAAGVVALRGGTTLRPVANSVVGLDSRGHLVHVIRAGATPDAVVATRQTLWVANFADSTITRVDLRDGRASTVGTPAVPTSLVDGAAAVWAASRFAPVAIRLDPTTGRIDATASLPQPADAIAYGLGALWAINEQAGTLTRLDPKTLHAKVIRRGLAGPSAIVVARGALWIASSFTKRLIRLNTRTGRMTSVPLALTPEQLAFGCGSFWLTNPADNEVTKIDARSLQPQLIAVGTNPTAVSAGDGYAWVTDDLSHAANEIDCHKATITKTLIFGTNKPGTPKLSPTSASVAPNGTAWIAIQSFSSARHP